MASFTKPIFEFPDLGEFIEELEEDTQKLPFIAAETMTETVEYLRDEMKKELKKKIRYKNKSTGAALNAIKSEAAKINGDTVTAKVGALYIRGKDKSGFHLVYLENGSPTRAATPWFAPVVDRENAINNFIRKKLKEKGIPIE